MPIQANNNPDYREFLEIFPTLQRFQALAQKYNISDIFQDNGGKYVQLLIILGLTTDGSREGNDAKDQDGNEYEIKTVNLDLQRQFTTHHHLNPTIIAKYRQVDWFFAAFESIELKVIYKMTPAHMEPFYTKWEEKWHMDGGKDINNPKIPLAYIMQHGEVVWLPDGIEQFIPPKKKTRTTPKVKRGKK